MSGHVLAVGQPYHPDNPTFARGQDVYDFNYRGGAYELRLFLQNPSQAEVASVQQGDAEFALVEYKSIILLCYKFGQMNWADSGFNYHLVNEEDRTVPPKEDDDMHALLTTILVDSYSGNVMALRVCTWSPEFTKKINQRIRKQALQSWCGIATHTKHGQELCTAYTSEELAEKVAVARCKAGD